MVHISEICGVGVLVKLICLVMVQMDVWLGEYMYMYISYLEMCRTHISEIVFHLNHFKLCWWMCGWESNWYWKCQHFSVPLQIMLKIALVKKEFCNASNNATGVQEGFL